MTDFEKWLEEAWRLAKAEILIRKTLNQEGRTGKTFAKALRMLEVAADGLREFSLSMYESQLSYSPKWAKELLAQINQIAKEGEK